MHFDSRQNLLHLMLTNTRKMKPHCLLSELKKKYSFYKSRLVCADAADKYFLTYQ